MEKQLAVLLIVLHSTVVKAGSVDEGIKLASTAFLYNEYCEKLTFEQIRDLKGLLQVFNIDLDKPLHKKLLESSISEQRPSWVGSLQQTCAIYKKVFN